MTYLYNLPISETNHIKRIALPYQTDSSALFDSIASQPWAVFLDSGTQHDGRYDILTANPHLTLITEQGITTVKEADKLIERWKGDPFTCLQRYLEKEKKDQHLAPFSGGALGYFAYDLCRYFERLPSFAKKDNPLPDMMVGLYNSAIVVDHHKQETVFITQCDDALLKQLEGRCAHPAFSLTSDKFVSNLSFDDYAKKFERVQQHLFDGDCYQINLSQRFSSSFTGSPWRAYQHLRTHCPAPFGAYCHYPTHHILSLSPERFLKINNWQVETKPIKGTMPRATDPIQDQLNAQHLLASEKDRAENLMIVDLLRNDLGRVCKPGSIHVPSLFALESFPAVHHLVSTVKGQLQSGYSSLDCLRTCFPGGSITGAPKIRAMEIIETLEPVTRGIYCGSIGYINYQGDMDTNIAIRTMSAYNNQLFCSAGGGLVADSECQAEYQETLDKVGKMLTLLQSAP